MADRRGNSSRATLGNLMPGSTELHMNRLIDKWVAGVALPTNLVGGDSARAASSIRFNHGQMTGDLFVDDVSFDDINQGQAGTCHFLAAAATFATNQKQLIRSMFCDNGDGANCVRFYGSSGNELWVTVNRSIPVLTNQRLALAGNAARSLTGEMRVALAKKPMPRQTRSKPLDARSAPAATATLRMAAGTP